MNTGKQYTIQGRLAGLNEYTLARNSNRYKGNNLKQEQEELILWYLRPIVKFEQPVHITFKWYEPNQKRDKDNVCFAKKFILDAMVKQGILPNDGWHNIQGFTDEFDVDKTNPRVEVTITTKTH